MSRRSTSPAAALGWMALTGAAYLGNVYHLPLFFNVDFLFGSIFLFVVLHYYGWAAAIVSALIASSYTAVLWQHPYAVIIMTLEVAAVGYFYRRHSRNLMFLDTVYWIILGMPLVVLLYGGVMGIAEQSTFLIVFKQAINGIVNALGASLLIAFAQHAFPTLGETNRRTPYTFSQAIFLVMVAFVLLPAMVILVVTARAEMNRIEEDVASKLSITTFSTRQAVSAWITENLQTLSSLARFADMYDPDRISVLRTEMALLKMSNENFAAMAVVDPLGRVVAGEPGIHAERLLGGADLAGCPYFARVVSGVQGMTSNVITRDGPSIVMLGVPIVERDIVSGVVVGIIDVDRLREMLVRLSGNWTVDVTIVDANYRVVTGTSEATSISDDFAPRYPESHEHLRDNLYIRVPETHQNVSIMQRWQHSEYLTRERIGPASGWSIILEAPVAPYQDALNTRYRSMLLVMLLVVVGTILLSAALSRRMLASLTQLTVIAENLPDKVTRQEELDWPSSRINEIDTLINCFRLTSAHLGESFSRIQEANLQLIAAKQEAETASNTKSEFLANISHDLRTPLNGILGYAQILSRDLSLDPRTRDAVAIIEKSGNHLLNLINDILDVSRIEANKLVLQPEGLLLRGFLDDIADIVSLQARQKGLRIHAEFDPALPRAVTGDPKRLRQVLLNLLTNAVKFTESGDIWFRAGRDAGVLRFEVEDTGVGIPADQFDEIFSPFKQLSKHIQSEEGTGLGLAIVKRLVEMMGGEVAVESTPGVGSRFSVTVDLPVADSVRAAPQASSGVSGYEGPRRKVLVIDDKWENRSVLRGMLEPIGFKILEAGDGAEGLSALEDERPELVFMDLVMPVMDGFEAIRAIRASSRVRATRVVAISASVADTIRHECLRVGFDDFLPKPFRQYDLLESIRRLIGLVWVHDSDDRRDEPPDAGDRTPPAEMLERLETHAASGNIRRILETADEIRRTDASYAGVAHRVTAMAQDFQVNRLTDYIQRLRRATVGGDD